MAGAAKGSTARGSSEKGRRIRMSQSDPLEKALEVLKQVTTCPSCGATNPKGRCLAGRGLALECPEYQAA